MQTSREQGERHIDLADVASDIRTWDAVAVLGAGVSVSARLPPGASLDALLWMALDADSEALKRLQGHFGIKDVGAKATLLDPRVPEQAAWRALAASAHARTRFQEGFAALDRERRTAYSAAHDVLAEMLHRGFLAHIVSLNWDTQVEAAWIARYGQLRTLQSRLTKPHGDAQSPTEQWVLPSESAALPAPLLARLEAMASERPRVLVVVGYSERDEEVVREIITPLEERWKVVRIGVDAETHPSLRGKAEEVLPELRDAIEPAPEASGWAYVNFEEQHDLAWALSGRRLGPKDVEACPSVPEVAQTISELQTTGAATIIGPSGSGKSLAAAQAAFSFWKAGAETVMLAESELNLGKLARSLDGLPRPVIAVVDDAQRLGSSQLETLLSRGKSDLRILAVVNEAGPTSGVRLDPEATVDRLSEHIADRSDELLPVIAQLDPQIGDGYLDEPLARRLRQARSTAKTPWQFTYILTGGWRRIRGSLAELRREDGYDLMVGLVAIVQEIRLDGIAERDELIPLAEAAGRDASWTEAALLAAEHQRLIVSEGSGYRLPHLRFCEAVFSSVLDGTGRQELLSSLAAAIERQGYSLAGISWLLRALRFSEEPWRRRDQLSATTASKLAARCWKASAAEAGPASYVLDALRLSNPETVEVAPQAAVVAAWISEAVPESMQGLANLVNSLYNEDHGNLEAICSQIQRPGLIRAFEQSGWPDAYLFGGLFDRLGLGPDPFRDQVRQEIDRDAFRSLFSAWPLTDESDLYLLSGALRGLASFDLDLALEQIEGLAVSIGDRWQRTFHAGYSELMDIQFLLGFGPHFLRRRKPGSRGRRIMRKISQALDPESVATQISHSKRREWQGVGEGLFLIREVSRPLAEDIATRVDFERLDEATAPFWGTPIGELSNLLIGLAVTDDDEPASRWLESNLHRVKQIDPLAIQLAPAACIRRLQESGDTLDLGHATLNWGFTADGLIVLARTDPDLARSSVAKYATSLANSFVAAALDDEAERLIGLLIKVAPDEFRQALGSIDPTKAQKMWEETLRKRKKAPCRAVALLLDLALDTGSPLREVALELRRQFPVTATAER